jgi:signal peptidase I
MKISWRWMQSVLAALILVMAVAAWVIFAPSQMGGQAVYVIVNGISMEPEFHFGDLVIARSSPSYLLGDIVVYHNAELNSLVFHRIVSFNLDHVILKGDNNSWIDTYQPTHAELIGKYFIRIPNAGNIVKWLKMPLSMGILAGSMGVVLMALFLSRGKRGKNMKKHPQQKWLVTVREWVYRNFLGRFMRQSKWKAGNGGQPGKFSLTPIPPDRAKVPSKNRSLKDLGAVLETALFILGFIALASFIMGIIAYTRPVSADIVDNINFKQLGTFSYTTTAPAGIYDSTTVTTGDPLFPKLTCTMNMLFIYNFLGDQAQGLAGTHQVTAIIQDNLSGWQRTLPLEARTAFDGNTFVSNTNLNLCEVEAIVAAMEDATDLHQSYYSLVINPRVSITGTMSARVLQTVFEPQLNFMFDQVHFYVYKVDPASDPLNPAQDGYIAGTLTQENTISLLGLKLEVSKTRVISLVLLGISLGALLFLGLYISRKVRGSQEALVQVKYGSLLVDVKDKPLETSFPSIDVITMDDLARLAERNSGVILHEAHGLVHYYFVQGDRIIYRYMINDGPGGSQEVSQLQLEENLQLGMDRGEFQVYYQPIVSLIDGKISSVEALLRWQHPQRGLISAGEFISLAEKTGLIDRMGEWMLQVACMQFEVWQKAGMQIKLAINLSEYQLQRDPAEIISRVLQKTGVDPRTLQIEISEANIIRNMSAVLPALQKLKALGLQLSVDNIGGQSPLSSLGQFPINSVKIDRLVIENIGDPDSANSVGAIIDEGINQGLNVVAEGVETEEQLEFLRSHLCTLAQGYLLGRPASAEDVTLLLEKGLNQDGPKPVKRKPRSREGAK